MAPSGLLASSTCPSDSQARAWPSATCEVGFSLVAARRNCSASGWSRFHQHQAEIQIGFEHVGLGRDGLAIGGNRVVGLAQRVVEKSQVKPGGKVVGILRDHLFQQRFGSGVVLLFDGALGLDEFRRGRGIVHGDFVVADGLAAFGQCGKGKQRKQYDHT